VLETADDGKDERRSRYGTAFNNQLSTDSRLCLFWVQFRREVFFAKKGRGRSRAGCSLETIVEAKAGSKVGWLDMAGGAAWRPYRERFGETRRHQAFAETMAVPMKKADACSNALLSRTAILPRGPNSYPRHHGRIHPATYWKKAACLFLVMNK